MRPEVYPGIENRFVICDVCGKKFRVKDTIKIKDRYNLLNNMIVCLADADKVNPQIMPFRIREDLLTQKDYVRPEETNESNVNYGTTLPSAPRNLTATPLGSDIQLNWDGPLNYGNALVLGYRIYRGFQPFHTHPTIINSNTNSQATFFLDETGELDGEYFYQVSVMTSAGESPLSNVAFYPIDLFNFDNFEALIVTGNLSLITTGDGHPIMAQSLGGTH